MINVFLIFSHFSFQHYISTRFCFRQFIFEISKQHFMSRSSFFSIVYLNFFSTYFWSNFLFNTFVKKFFDLFWSRIDCHLMLNTIVILTSIDFTLKINWIIIVFLLRFLCNNFSSHFNLLLHYFEFNFAFI